MGAVLARTRADLRNRWAAWLALGALVAVFVGGVSAIALGARRTDTAYPRFARQTQAPDLAVFDPPDPTFASFRTSEIAHLPGVTAIGGLATYSVVRPAAVALIAPTSEVGRTFWFRKVLSGRLPLPSEPNDVAVSFMAAENLHLRPGDHIVVDLKERSGAVEQVRLHVVGVEAAVTEFPPQTGTGTDGVWLTPAFVQHHPELRVAPGWVVRLAGGARQIPQAEAALARLARGKPTESFSVDLTSANAQRSIHLQATALWILAGLLGIAATLIVGQLLARQSATESAGYRELRALGMTTRQIWAIGMLRAGLIAVAAGLVGVAGAAAASGIFPVGLAAIAEPHPGLSFDVAGLAIAGLVAAALVVAVAAWPNWRVAASASWVDTTTRERAGRSRLAAAARDAGAPVPVATGIGLALERGSGRSATPVRSTMAASIIGIATLAGAAVFSSSLAHLVSTPELYGVRWDAIVTSSMGEGVPLTGARTAVASDHQVAAVAQGYVGFPLTSGQAQLSGVALESVQGSSLQPTLRAGRLPAADDEIALGVLDLDHLHTHLGGTVPLVIAGIGGVHRYHVVGTAVFPNLSDNVDLGHGVLLTVGALTSVVGGQAPPADTILVRFEPGTNVSAAVAALDREVGRQSPDLNALPAPQPVDLVNFGRVRQLPELVGVLLAALALGTLVHLLVTAIRSRRRDLAVLQVLGFTPRQLRQAVAWQAAAVAALALVVGTPLGIMVGRWLWITFTEQLGVETVVIYPWLVGLALVAIVVVVSQLVAALPARAASRTNASRVLSSAG
jgi:hypothetical protein